MSAPIVSAETLEWLESLLRIYEASEELNCSKADHYRQSGAAEATSEAERAAKYERTQIARLAEVIAVVKGGAK